MPIVHGCIVPPAVDPSAVRTAGAVARVAEGLRALAPEAALACLGPLATRPDAIGVVTQAPFPLDATLTRAVLDAAQTLTMPAAEVHATGPLELPEPARDALGGVAIAAVHGSVLSAREHLELGRAVARAAGADARRIAVVCCGTLSGAHGRGEPGDVFDKHVRRVVEEWDVRWLAAVDAETRRRAREDCVAQLALLMGALSRSRMQPHVLSYEAAEGGGLLVAAVDVLGDRRKKRHV